MRDVSIEPGPSGESMAEALAAAGFRVAGAVPWARIVAAADTTFEEVSLLVDWVLAGGVLAIPGGTGPLLAALALTQGDAPVEGAVVAAAPGAPPVDLAGAWPVTGVGYAVYRVGERSVAIAGRRGNGWVAYALNPQLLAACLSWIA